MLQPQPPTKLAHGKMGHPKTTQVQEKHQNLCKESENKKIESTLWKQESTEVC